MTESKVSYEFGVIGYIESCYKQKFGTPRQPGLVKQATAKLTLLPEFSHPDIVRGLDQYSHVWLVFVFHQSILKKPKNTVRPPRLGGNERMGIFATRSNFRPNPIGQSVVKLEKIETFAERIVLHLSGIDLLDGTPILDIKPYLSYVDAIPDAVSGFAVERPKKKFSVGFTDQCNVEISQYSEKMKFDLREMLIDLLALDPRPGYLQENSIEKNYRMSLYDFDVSWRVEGDRLIVTGISSE